MAHSYVQPHDDELDAFRRFTARYPATALLVDTYDTLAGVRHVIDLARERGAAFQVRAIRLDSGPLGELARQARQLLDDAGLTQVRIIASGGLDEDAIAALLAAQAPQAPIDGFGVGTQMGVSRDAPALDIAYKLTEYAGRQRTKLSAGKAVLPGRKQVFRIEESGTARYDVIALAGETHPGRPLLIDVMHEGQRRAVMPRHRSRNCPSACARSRLPSRRTASL